MSNVTLSEKIQYLRKEKGYSQEALAEICQVSRQSISKWETGYMVPDIDKLLILNKTFNVSIDILLHDDYEINSIKEVHHCGSNAIRNKKVKGYKGILIKESIDDDSVLDYLNIHKIELWNTGSIPKYWTALYFTSNEMNLPEYLSKTIISKTDGNGNWFVDFKSEKIKYIVFRNKILTYTIGNIQEKEQVLTQCRLLGITDAEMNWSD